MADESSCLSPDLFENEENSSMSVEEKNVVAPGGGGGSSPKKNAGDGEEEKVESPTTSKAKSAAATEKEAAEFDLSDGDDDDDDDDDTEFEANALRIVEDADEEEEEDDEESDEEIEGKKSVNVPASNGSSSSRKNVQHKSSENREKRKVDEADWSSEDDEEAFAGFGDTSGEFSSRGATHLLQGHENKKIKTEIADSPIKKEIKEEKISPETVMKEEKLEKDEGAARNIPSPLPAAENPHPQPMATSTPGNNLTPPFNKKGKILPPSDPIYRVPFEYGWKRELVLRAIPEVSKEKGEVYYITPTGKKLRTRNEIYNHLPKDGALTMNHFTFSKESLGVSAEFEVIRSAKLSSSTIRRTNFDMSNDMSLTTMGKRVPKPKVPKGASPPPTNRLTLKTGRNPTGIRDSKDGKISEDVSGKTSKSKSEPCTIQCVLAMGTIPQLQCKKCLCLYHHECVGLGASTSIVENYVCQGCRPPPEPLSNIPPLQLPPPLSTLSTPVAEHASTTKNSSAAAQEKPEPTQVPSNEPHHQTPMLHHHRHNFNRRNSAKGENVVDSLTTWHYNTANISTNRNILNSFDTPPQTIASINGRKFIVVPKTNVLSVSPSNEMKHNEDSGDGGGGGGGGASGGGGGGGVASSGIGNGDYHMKLQGDNRHSHNRRGGINADSRKAPTDQENLSPPSSTIKLNNNISSSAVVKSRVSDNLGNNSFEMMDCSGGSMSEASSSHFSKQFFSNVSVGYYVLLHTFQYLKVQELLRAACVCRLWNQAANHTNLWRTVRMKNSQVNDWNGLAATLINNGARHLDLRKMLSPSNITTEESWTQFSKIIGTIKNLESIDLCKCSTTIVEHLFESNSNLRVLNALTLKDDVLNLEKVSNLKNLVELRLKSSEGLIVDDITPLSELKSIKHLSLTSIKELGTKNIEVLGELTSLESLELGECTEFNNSFVENVLTCLTSLQRLRLEKGQNNCSSFEILAGIAKMENLIQLELINFDVRTEFDDYISKCTNIKKLLIIPTYVSQSATTNQIVLNGVMQLSPTLQSFTWAVTGELVRVTELYVDNCDANKRSKKSLSDCIPVLKPVPGILDSTQIMSKRVAADVPQVEILPLTSVEKILITAMPTTSVHMVIIPYHGTWRQNLVEN